MRKNLIVEGVDGSGKTRLIEQLREDYPSLGEVRRACTPEGPIEDTMTWVDCDATTLSNGIYDRHPIVSDRVYPDVLRMPHKINPIALGNYTSLLVKRSVFVFCDPSLHTIRANLAADKGVQMAGVRENVQLLHLRYCEVMAKLKNVYGAIVWPYDYRGYTEYETLSKIIERIVL